MALDTYSNLKATVIRFAGRDDLSDLLDDLITLTEEMIYFNDNMPLRLRSFETSSSLVTVAGTNAVALPATYLQLRSLSIEVDGVAVELTYNSPSAIAKKYTSGFPQAFTIEGTNLVFDRTPDAVYTLTLKYYAKPTDLSSSNPTNDVLTNYPSIYLNGCLSALYDYTGEIDDAENYYQKMIRSIKGAIRGDRTGRYGVPASKVRGSTP